MAARRYPSPWQDRIAISIDHASTNATLTLKFHKALLPFVIEDVQYINPTGLAADPTNYFSIELKDGATSIAKWATQTSQQGTIAPATFVAPILNAIIANRYGAAADVLSLVLTLNGTQTLPAGRLVAHGRYL